MRTLLAFAILGCFAGPAPAQEPNTVPVTVLNDREFVPAKSLPQAAQIAVKPLPGRTELAACFEDRCVLLTKSMQREGDWWIDLSELSDALGLQATLDETRSRVHLAPAPQPAPHQPSELGRPFGVGQLAPNFRLPKLDGTWVTLSDLRGKRVLINSWASW